MTLTGLFVPLITPFDAEGSVDLDALAALGHRVLDGGATGVVALGSTGEPYALTDDERRAVVEVARGVCRERSATLIVGANTALELEALGGQAEVGAALTLVPPFVRPGEDGVLAHFRHLAAASPVPVVIYHIPYRTGQGLSTGCLHELGRLSNVVGLKYSVGRIDSDTVALLADPPAGLAVLGGDDQLISPLLALGAHGGILASAHLATAQFADLIETWRTGDVDRARALGHRLAALSQSLFAEPNPTVIKAVLYAQGQIPTPAVRLPLLPASTSTTRAALRLAAPDALGRRSSMDSAVPATPVRPSGPTNSRIFEPVG